MASLRNTLFLRNMEMRQRAAQEQQMQTQQALGNVHTMLAQQQADDEAQRKLQIEEMKAQGALQAKMGMERPGAPTDLPSRYGAAEQRGYLEMIEALKEREKLTEEKHARDMELSKIKLENQFMRDVMKTRSRETVAETTALSREQVAKTAAGAKVETTGMKIGHQASEGEKKRTQQQKQFDATMGFNVKKLALDEKYRNKQLDQIKELTGERLEFDKGKFLTDNAYRNDALNRLYESKDKMLEFMKLRQEFVEKTTGIRFEFDEKKWQSDVDYRQQALDQTRDLEEKGLAIARENQAIDTWYKQEKVKVSKGHLRVAEGQLKVNKKLANAAAGKTISKDTWRRLVDLSKAYMNEYKLAIDPTKSGYKGSKDAKAIRKKLEVIYQKMIATAAVDGVMDTEKVKAMIHKGLGIPMGMPVPSAAGPLGTHPTQQIQGPWAPVEGQGGGAGQSVEDVLRKELEGFSEGGR